MKCGIINKFAAKPDGSRRVLEGSKKSHRAGQRVKKKFRKPLDKSSEMWYNKRFCNQAGRESESWWGQEKPQSKAREKRPQKDLKTFKNLLTNFWKCGIIEKHASWSRETDERADEHHKDRKKKLQETLKKDLTNFLKCGIIKKSPDEASTLKAAPAASWKLNNARKEKARIKLEPLVNSERRNLFCIVLWEVRQDYKTNSNCERFVSNEPDFKAERSAWRYKLMKSLILAQDERWRHA